MKEKLKFKILFCEIYDDGTVGGSHSTMYNLVSNLKNESITPIVGFLKENLYFEKYKKNGISVVDLPDPHPNDFFVPVIRKMINWYRLVFRKEKELENLFRHLRIDLVVINNTLRTALPYINACKKLELPIVIHERGINHYSLKEIKSSANISISIPVSDATNNSLISQKVRSKKIVRVYDGIDSEKLRPVKVKEVVKQDLNIPLGSRIIGMIGNVKPWKGQRYVVDALIQLCSEYKDLYGVIVGAWKGKDIEFKNQMDQLILDAGLSERIIFTGYRTDVPDLLSVFDVFVHASIKPEPFGMVVTEAMAARTPVIATNFGGPLESLNNGKCGLLVSPENAQEIELACKRYLNDNIFRSETIEKAFKHYEQYFMLSNSVETLTNLYLEALSK